MSNTPPPLVTVGVPVYNGRRYLRECLESILSQTLDRFEVAISDNASTDDTQQICEEFARRDPRIRYTRQSANRGAAANYNAVFRQARAPYFRWAAHDDVLHPRLLEACVEGLESDAAGRYALAWPRAKLIHGDGSFKRLVTERPPWVGDTALSRAESLLGDEIDTLLYKCLPVFGVMRTHVLASTRLIQRFNSSDKVLLLELALRGDFLEIPETLFLRRSHEETSLNVHRTPEAVMAWFDPSRAHAPPMPRFRLFLGYLTAILGAPLSLPDRLRALETLRRWVVRDRNWWGIWNDLRNRVRQELGLPAR